MFDKKKMNKQLINEMEIASFLSVIRKFWRKEIELVDVNDQNVKIPQKYLEPFLREIIQAFKGNLSTRIYGVEHMQGFEMKLSSDIEHVEKMCTFIWNNPRDFYEYNTEDDCNDYYEFLRYLWVDIPGYGEHRLCDIVARSQEKFDFYKTDNW